MGDVCECHHIAGLHEKRSARCILCDCARFVALPNCAKCEHSVHTYGCGAPLDDRVCDCFTPREDDPSCQYERAAVVAWLRGGAGRPAPLSPERAVWFSNLALEIERGEHLKP